MPGKVKHLHSIRSAEARGILALLAIFVLMQLCGRSFAARLEASDELGHASTTGHPAAEATSAILGSDGDEDCRSPRSFRSAKTGAEIQYSSRSFRSAKTGAEIQYSPRSFRSAKTGAEIQYSSRSFRSAKTGAEIQYSSRSFLPTMPPRILEWLDGPIQLEAGHVEFDEKEERLRAWGEVRLEAGPYILTTGALTADLRTARLRIESPFKLMGPQETLVGESGELEFDPFLLIVNKGKVSAADGDGWLRANRFERHSDGRIMLWDSELSPCSCPKTKDEPHQPSESLCGQRQEYAAGESAWQAFLERPSWSVSTESAIIRPPARPDSSGRIHLHRAVLRIKGLPILYLPGLSLPIHPPGSSRLEPPSIFYNRDGLNVRLPYRLTLGSASDLGLSLTYIQTRGLEPELDLHYGKDSWPTGSLRANWIYDFSRKASSTELDAAGSSTGLDPTPHRWTLTWQHHPDPKRRLRLVADLTAMSDPEMPIDFGERLENRAAEYIRSTARIDHQFDGGTLSASFLQFYDLENARGFTIPGRLPELQANLRLPQATVLGGRVWSQVATDLFFQVTPGGAASGGFDEDAGTTATNELAGALNANEETVVAGLDEDTETVRTSESAGGFPDRAYAQLEANVGWQRLLGRWAKLGVEQRYLGVAEFSPGEEEQTPALFQEARGRLELSTALVRSFRRKGQELESLYHRVEPALFADYDYTYRRDVNFEAPIGASLPRVKSLSARLTQRLLGQWRDASGKRYAHLAMLRLEIARLLDEGEWTDLEAELRTQGPIALRALSLLPSRPERPSWLLTGARWQGDWGWLELDYGFIDSTREAITPRGERILPKSSASELRLGASMRLRTLPSLIGKDLRWLNAWTLDGLVRLEAAQPWSLTSGRLSLRYDSPCHCFGAEFFLALDTDRSSPEFGGTLWPQPFTWSGL